MNNKLNCINLQAGHVEELRHFCNLKVYSHFSIELEGYSAIALSLLVIFCPAPHWTSETTSLNESRFIILNLSKPLAVTSDTIQTNIVKIQEEEERLKGLDTEANDFESKLKIQRFYYEPKELRRPCTVCINCAEVGQTKDGIHETIYKARCHDPCYLKGIPRDTPQHPDLQKCYAMNADGMCKRCGCKWDVHMHIWYLQKIKSELVDDPEVKRMLNNNANKKAIQQKAIENLKKKVKEWKVEQTFINDVAAKASDFLKKNSIVAYNDAVEEYLKMQINEVRRQEEASKDYRRLEGLENSLKAYQKKKGILEESLGSMKIGHQRKLGTTKIGHHENWAPRKLGTTKIGHQRKLGTTTKNNFKQF